MTVRLPCWLRNSNMLGEERRLIGPPPELWDALDFLKPDLLPDGMKQRFHIRIWCPRTRKHFTAFVAYKDKDDAAVWWRALDFVLALRCAARELPDDTTESPFPFAPR